MGPPADRRRLRLIYARIERRLTQADLGQALGVSHAAVGAWERGDATPEHRRIAEIAEVLEMDEADVEDWFYSWGAGAVEERRRMNGGAG